MKSPSRPLLKISAPSYTGNVHIHDYQESCHDSQEDGIVEIGRCCSLGTDIHIQIYGNRGNHDYLRVTTSPLMPLINYKDFISPVPREDVRIGNDVWISNDVRILSGVKIGDGAVIGTMAVITKDIPPYAVVIGNPAKIKTYRFSELQIASPLKISWWDWPQQKIAKNVHLLMNRDIDGFIAVHGEGNAAR
jgi:acetyltransferase-like isoleucine patch superfamily enzyme